MLQCIDIMTLRCNCKHELLYFNHGRWQKIFQGARLTSSIQGELVRVLAFIKVNKLRLWMVATLLYGTGLSIVRQHSILTHFCVFLGTFISCLCLRTPVIITLVFYR